MSENIKKCIKCGSSPAKETSITLHRFPKPGKTNSLRCERWAKFCFPHEAWASPEFQQKLYSQHKMLCSKHFTDTCFVDRKLFRTAVPNVDCDEVPTPIFVPVVEPYMPIAGPSGIRNPLMENLNITNVIHNVLDVAPQQSKSQFSSTKSPQTEKERKLHCKMMLNMKKVWRLQKTIKHLKIESFVNILSNDASVNNILKTKMTSTMALFLQGELQNFKRTPRARRWSTEAKIIALRLYKRSPTCYKLLRRLICLPAPGTLKTFLNQFEMSVGINKKIFSVLKNTIKHWMPADKEFVLMFDEMSIKKNCGIIKKDIIEGFQDHDAQGRSPQIASYALVFMVAGIRKSIKQPVAYYLSGGSVTADRLAVLIKEVLQSCFDAGLSIAATVSDLDGVNKRAITILGATAEQPFIKFGDKEIITILDTPHLFKCFRNLFLKYDIECQTDITSDNKCGMGVAKWSYIKQFYELDCNNPNFVYAPILKQEHLNPNNKQKMRVNLAAQVLSSSVSGGMYSRIAEGGLPTQAVVTANVVKNMDKLFDAVNASSPDLRRGKRMSTNLTEKTDHLNFFKEIKEFFKDLKFIECRSSPPSKEGWIWTLNGLEKLWHNLKNKHKNIQSLATRRIQQDPLENLFGCIRSNCGCNTNPTTGQFTAGLKTSVLSCLAYVPTGNCEKDENDVLVTNFKMLFKDAQSTLERNNPTDDTTSISENLYLIEDENIDDTSSEMQACAYVCGFIVKNNKIKNTCELCTTTFVSETPEEVHNFTQFKEYEEYKNSLTYASKNLITIVEKCATVINSYLEKEAYKNKVKISICNILQSSVNWDFLNQCVEHKQSNQSYIINSAFFICIKRFCVLKNRQFAEDSNKAALKRKINILKHV